MIIGVVQTAFFISVHGHLVRHEGVQGNDLILAVADDLGVSVTPQEQVCHERFPEHKRTHFRVRLIMEQPIQWMVESHGLATAVGVFIKVKRQSRYRLRQNTDTGVHRRHLHGRPLGHCFAGGRAAHEKGIVAACRAILRLVPGFEQT